MPIHVAFDEDIKCEHQTQWKLAMDDDIRSLAVMHHGCFLVYLRENIQYQTDVLSVKQNPDETIEE